MKHGYLVVGLATLVSVGPATGQRQSSISIEIEDLAGSARISGGQTARQDMRGFGPGWSGSAQLFWGAPPPVDKPIRNWPHLAVSFDAPNSDTYEVILHYTSAPDFATFRVFLDGRPVADIDGYGPTVAPHARGLGQHKLSPAKHELLVTVFGKAGVSRGFSVGLDRIELRATGGNTNLVRGSPQVRTPGGATQSVTQPGAPPAAAQLYFAAVSSITQKWTEKSGTERTLDRPNLTAHLVWESAFANKFAWRWQIAVQPFSGPVSVPPAGLVAEREVSTSAFTIDLGSLPPLSGRMSPATRPSTIDFYIRLVASDGGQPAGVASNVVVAHYVPGSDQSLDVTRDALKKAEEAKAKSEALKALNTIYTVDVLSFKPAMFANPNRWGCVVIAKNPYASSLPGGPMAHPLSRYEPGEHCGASYSGQGHTLTPWDYITGWAKAYEIVSEFYDEAKAWAATQFANTLPCDMLGKAAAECKKYGEQLAGAAINVGLVAAGVPPTMPDLSAAAKGKAVEVGVNFTCDSIESSGGKCSPELRSALAKAYGTGLDKLEKQLDRTTKEPGCNSVAQAHAHGREPLPCFGDYPGVEFRPADGAVYQPPMVTVRVTRTAPGSPELERSGYELRAELALRNTFEGQIESYYQPVPPTDLSGELFVPATLTLPSLAMGQSATVMLQMGGIKQYTFSSTKGGYAKHNGWCALYNGGTGSVFVSASCRNANGAPVSCAVGAKRSIQLPKDYMCTVG